MSQTREPPILRQWKNHLPHDVVLNILARLPVKSVLRFRCVCKSWNSSITSPNFIFTHLNINNNNNNNGSLILMPWSTRDNRTTSTVTYHRTFPRISRFEIPLTFQSLSVDMVGSFNGLLCLFDRLFVYLRGFTSSLVYLWNPSIRKLKKLPDTCLSKLENVLSGFAYLSDSNDYKVVRISCCLMRNGILTKSKAVAEVYTLSSDSWRRVMLGPNVFISYVWYKFPVPFVNGALHWIVCMSESVKEPPAAKILTFDVNSETFGNIALPSVSAGFDFLHLAVFKGNLALIEHSPCNPRYILVWVMRECGVWDRPFDVSFKKGKQFLGFTRDGELLFQTSNAILSFDPETSRVKHLVSQCDAIVATFMESLVLLDKANIPSE